VRAAVVTSCGQPPHPAEREAPVRSGGSALVAVTAAPITPLDLLCATGTSYFGTPAVPYVPGVQGVGTVVAADALPAGTRVWFPTNAGMRPGDGSMAELCAVPEPDLVPLDLTVDDALVAGLGLSAVAAWMALTWRGGLRPGEQLLVLGGGGIVGQVGVQAARLLGAGRVVAACRSRPAQERAHRAGADAVVELRDTDDVDGLAGRLREACTGPVDLVLDPLFGVPAAAALRTLGPHGRLVNLGSSAGEQARLESATLRSRSLRILGYTNNELSPEQRATAVRTVAGHAATGALRVDYERVSLAEVDDAWRRQVAGTAAGRIVLAPAGA
jgi:NADPH:quinone reductase-like Zn-dependent oxidoreductase